MIYFKIPLLLNVKVISSVLLLTTEEVRALMVLNLFVFELKKIMANNHRIITVSIIVWLLG